MSIHDYIVDEAFTTFFSKSCAKVNPELEDFFCFGCNSLSEGYIDESPKQIRMCKSYLDRLWGSDIDYTSTKFDYCGVYTYWDEQPKAVIPSQVINE